jgi:hypothetical protein
MKSLLTDSFPYYAATLPRYYATLLRCYATWQYSYHHPHTHARSHLTPKHHSLIHAPVNGQRREEQFARDRLRVSESHRSHIRGQPLARPPQPAGTCDSRLTTATYSQPTRNLLATYLVPSWSCKRLPWSSGGWCGGLVPDLSTCSDRDAWPVVDTCSEIPIGISVDDRQPELVSWKMGIPCAYKSL